MDPQPPHAENNLAPGAETTFHNYAEDFRVAAEIAEQDPHTAAIAAEVRQDIASYVEFMKTNPTEEQQDEYDAQEVSPKLIAAIQSHGIPAEIATLMADTWHSYSALSMATAGEDVPDDPSTIPPADLQRGIEAKVLRVQDQYASMINYLNTYGLDELLELHGTFKIVNFNRGRPEEFHDQLERWQAGEPARHVEAATYPTYNHSMDQEASRTLEKFGRPGTFYFEFNGKTQLAQTMIAVGARERAHGREPNVDDVIISGHGLEDSIEASVSEDLTVEDFVAAAAARQKLPGARRNTFQQHLGNRYRLILNACRVAGTPEDGSANLAETIHDETGRPVHASPVDIWDYEVTPEGDVIFHPVTGDDYTLAATVYSQPSK